MFDRLGEFRPRSGRQLWSAVGALLFHLSVLFAAIRATTSAAEMPSVRRDTVRLEFGPAPMPEPRAPVRPEGDFHLPAPTIPIEPPRLEVPDLPMPGPRVDLRALTGVSTARDSGEAPPVITNRGGVHSISEVDQPPELLGGLQPRYPASLRPAGLVGKVELEYLVSERGVVDGASVRVLSSTHAAFTAAACEALSNARFKPARRRGTPVAVLVRQTIRFVVH